MTARACRSLALAALLLGGCSRGEPTHELRVADGTLRAFNRGEFGGHVEWCRTGLACWTIDPPPSLRDTGTPWDLVRAREPDDFSHSENVVAFVRLAEHEVVVIGGLWHLGVTDGWVVSIRGVPPRWQRSHAAVRGVPVKWCRDGKDLLVFSYAFTEGDLTRLSPGGVIVRTPIPGTAAPHPAIDDPRLHELVEARRRAVREAARAMDDRFTDCHAELPLFGGHPAATPPR